MISLPAQLLNVQAPAETFYPDVHQSKYRCNLDNDLAFGTIWAQKSFCKNRIFSPGNTHTNSLFRR